MKRKQLAKERELATLREEIRKKKRNDDFRQKILLGAVVLGAMRINQQVRDIVVPLLEGAACTSKVERDKETLSDLLKEIASEQRR